MNEISDNPVEAARQLRRLAASMPHGPERDDCLQMAASFEAKARKASWCANFIRKIRNQKPI